MKIKPEHYQLAGQQASKTFKIWKAGMLVSFYSFISLPMLFALVGDSFNINEIASNFAGLFVGVIISIAFDILVIAKSPENLLKNRYFIIYRDCATIIALVSILVLLIRMFFWRHVLWLVHWH